ncbi:hypothetical protein [Persephonella sp.]
MQFKYSSNLTDDELLPYNIIKSIGDKFLAEVLDENGGNLCKGFNRPGQQEGNTNTKSNLRVLKICTKQRN